MGRPSNREERRREILQAFGRVMADHGYAGATIAAVAAEAGFAPGLVHHHFENKAELLRALLGDLVVRFRKRVGLYEAEEDRLLAYADGALRLDERADVAAARAWVGVFAEAIRDPALFAQVRRLLDAETTAIQQRANGALDTNGARSVLAFIVGSLVVGAFAPRATAGFAAPGLRALIGALRR
jgi:TetR/AcrR family transcriptional regulator, transcriptional repressor of bet genes